MWSLVYCALTKRGRGVDDGEVVGEAVWGEGRPAL